MKERLKSIFPRIILHSFSSGLLATLACFFYATFYYTLLFDFSEGLSKVFIFIAFFKNCLLAATLMSIIYYFLKGFFLKRGILADLLSGLFFSIATIAFVFYVLKMKDPVFKCLPIGLRATLHIATLRKEIGHSHIAEIKFFGQ